MPSKRSSQITAQKEKNSSTKLTIAQQEYHGILPHPDELKAFDDVVPGAAERILAMAERQAAHRQSIEASVIEEQLQQSRRGQNYAFSLSMAALLIGGAMGYTGHDWLAGIFVTSGAIGLASVFVAAKQKQRAELQRKKTPPALPS
jgi:uncharacterized membrane protein